MPQTAAWIDELREVFGVDEINHAIRKGIAGQPVFHAIENGYEIGTAFVDGQAVCLRDIVIPILPKTECELKSRRKK